MTAALIADVSAFHPGTPFVAGVRLEMAGGWHTYWINPGDSGLETSVSWSLPPGFVVGPLRWPAPKRFLDAGLASYGFDGVLVLPVAVTPPADWPVGETAVLRARVEWLQCRDICVPGEAEVGLVLAGAERPEQSADAGILRHAWKNLPRVHPDIRAAAVREGGAIRLTVRGLDAARPVLFASETGGIVRAAATPAWTPASEPGAFEARLPLEAGVEPPRRLRGVLQLEGGARPPAILLDFEIEGGTVKAIPTRERRPR